MKYHLITTAIEQTWGSTKPLLFLGDWCLLPHRNTSWENLDYKVNSYHWDNLEIVESEYIYCEDLYERLLAQLYLSLNNCHNLHWSIRSWRLMIGPWLRRYITIFFDRYQNIHTAINNNNIDSVYCSAGKFCDLTPLDRNDFSEKYKSDYWNYLCFSKIIRETTNLNYEILEIDNSEKLESESIPNNTINLKKSSKFGLKKIVGNLYRSKIFNNIEKLLTAKNDYFIYLPYFKEKISEYILHIKLKNFPLIQFIPDTIIQRNIKNSVRNKFKIEFQPKNKFEIFLKNSISELIPIIYLEEFYKVKDSVLNFPFPKNPKLIYTTIGIYSNETFKFWAAEKIENGCKLVVGQHGGQYATDKIPNESLPHEFLVSDFYFSWGWKIPGYNIESVPSPLTLNQKNCLWDENGQLVVIARYLYKYCYIHSAGSLPGNKNRYYLNLLGELCNLLSFHFKDNYVVRLHPGEGDEIEREVPIAPTLKASLPGIKISSPETSLESIFQKSRLNIFTYDGTPFLVSIGQNRPCILILSPRYDPLSDLVLPFYEQLKKAGIYHTNVESAVQHIRNISDNVNDWWGSDEVVNAKLAYRNHFSKTSYTDSGLQEYADILHRLVNSE